MGLGSPEKGSSIFLYEAVFRVPPRLKVSVQAFYLLTKQRHCDKVTNQKVKVSGIMGQIEGYLSSVTLESFIMNLDLSLETAAF